MTYETEPTPRSFQVSVREARLAVSRVLLTCGLPSGFVHAVTETILLSQAAGLSGFRGLTEDAGLLDMGGYREVELQQTEPGAMLINANGLHAWLLAPSVMDLLVDEARKLGSAKAVLQHVTHSSELSVLTNLATRHGVVASVLPIHGEEDSVTVQVSNTSAPRTSAQWDPLLDAAMRDGFPLPEAHWWDLYELSNRALAPDSVVSRRHAGPVIMLDDGTIQGRVPEDDDFDPTMLRSVVSGSETK